MAKPVKKFRIGLVEAAIWDNDGFYSVKLSRSYKDGEEWKNTDSFTSHDLLNAAQVLLRCEEWISKDANEK